MGLEYDEVVGLLYMISEPVVFRQERHHLRVHVTVAPSGQHIKAPPTPVCRARVRDSCLGRGSVVCQLRRSDILALHDGIKNLATQPM